MPLAGERASQPSGDDKGVAAAVPTRDIRVVDDGDEEDTDTDEGGPSRAEDKAPDVGPVMMSLLLFMGIAVIVVALWTISSMLLLAFRVDRRGICPPVAISGKKKNNDRPAPQQLLLWHAYDPLLGRSEDRAASAQTWLAQKHIL